MTLEPDDTTEFKPEEKSTPNSHHNTKTNRLSPHPKRKLLNPTTLTLATLIVTTIGVVISTALDLPGAILDSRTLSHKDTAPSATSAPSDQQENRASTDSKHTQQHTSSTEAAMSSGCYDGETLTPCSSPHTRELFAKPASSSCDEDTLVLYMGGVAGVDLLGPGLDVKPLDNADELCVVEKQSGMLTLSLKDIWTADNDHNGYKDGGEFRRCFNRQGQAVSCDTDHASEEFYNAADEVDCGKKYGDFSGRPVDHSIRVTRQPRDHRIVCRAEAQVSTDRLTASVRDLGNATLPIKQN